MPIIYNIYATIHYLHNRQAMKIIFILLIVFSSYLSAISKIEFTQEELLYLENKNYITMCIDPDWMPFERIENGKHIFFV